MVEDLLEDVLEVMEEVLVAMEEVLVAMEEVLVVMEEVLAEEEEGGVEAGEGGPEGAEEAKGACCEGSGVKDIEWCIHYTLYIILYTLYNLSRENVIKAEYPDFNWNAGLPSTGPAEGGLA